ncbi:membrane-associated protein, putative [Bodo saltans]|uniref:Membrane-associated protein, putative n=1 Tax=Bodo saltans TaxID=75058 RepID=A0A0S4JMP6_BODSA|nr:membrane-associated protein, putative [Bodo saltans]|eukprot:CUG90560.1 membrane-associated protein, putative [Bodo saltans]
MSVYQTLLILVILIIASCSIHLVAAISASGTVNVPCGVSTTYGPSIAAGTQLFLSNCYNSTGATKNGTMLIVSMTAATAAASSGLTIVVENSQRVAVQVYALLAVNISNLRVVIRNVSNDAAERITGSLVCSPASCKPLLDIYNCRNLVNASISVSDVVHVRNKSAVYIEDILAQVTGLQLSVWNVSARSNSAVVGVDTINGSVTLSSIYLQGVSHYVTSTSKGAVISVFFGDVPMIEDTNVTVTNSGISGATPTTSGAVLFSVQASTLASNCHVSLTNIWAQMTSTSFSSAVTFVNAAVSGASVNVFNFSVNQTVFSVTVIYFANATAAGGSVFVVDTAIVSSIASGTANPCLAIDVASSSMTDSSFQVRNVQLSSTASASELFRTYFSAAVASRQASLMSCNVSITDSSTTATTGVALFLYNISARNVQLFLSNVVTSTSQYMALFFYYLQPGSMKLNLVAMDCFFSGPNALTLDSSDVADSTLVLLFSTLVVTQSIYFDTVVYGLCISSTTLRSTSITIIASSISGLMVGSYLGRSMGVVLSSSLEDGTVISAQWTSIGSPAGLVAVQDSTMSNSSVVDVGVTANFSVRPSAHMSAVAIYNMIISSGCAVIVRLPPSVSMSSGTNTYPAIYLNTLTLSNRSSVRILGISSSSSLVTWPNSGVWLQTSTITSNSIVALSSLFFWSNTTITTITNVVQVSSCAFSGVSFLNISNVTVVVTATNLSTRASTWIVVGLTVSVTNFSATSILSFTGISCVNDNGINNSSSSSSEITTVGGVVVPLGACVMFDRARLASGAAIIIVSDPTKNQSLGNRNSLFWSMMGNDTTATANYYAWLFVNQSNIDNSSMTVEHVRLVVVAVGTPNMTNSAPLSVVVACQIFNSTFSSRIRLTLNDVVLQGVAPSTAAGASILSKLLDLRRVDLHNTSATALPFANIFVAECATLDALLFVFSQQSSLLDPTTIGVTSLATPTPLTLLALNVERSIMRTSSPLTAGNDGDNPTKMSVLPAVSITELGASASLAFNSVQFFGSSSLTTSSSVVLFQDTFLSQLSLSNSTFSIPWSMSGTTALVVLQNATSGLTKAALQSTTALTFNITVDRLMLYGFNSFVDSVGTATRNASAVTLQCSWWARHAFSSRLDPLTLALQGRIFHGARSVVAAASTRVSSDAAEVVKNSSACGMHDVLVDVVGSLSGSHTPSLLSLTKTPGSSSKSNTATTSTSLILSISLIPSSLTGSMANSSTATKENSCSKSNSISATPTSSRTWSRVYSRRSTFSLTASVPTSRSNLSASASVSRPRAAGASSWTRSQSLTSSPQVNRSSSHQLTHHSATLTETTIHLQDSSPTFNVASTATNASTKDSSISESRSSCVRSFTNTTTPQLLPSATNRPTRTAILTPSRSPQATLPTLSLAPTKTLTNQIPPQSFVLGAARAIEAAAFVAAAGSLVGGGAVGEAATIAALSMLTCGGKKTWDSNTGPQRLVVSVFYDLGPGAAVVGNIGIVVIVFLAQYFIVRIVRHRNANAAGKYGHRSSTIAYEIDKDHLSPRHIQEELASEIAARVRFPSIAWSVFTFLLPGILFSAISLLTSDNEDTLFSSHETSGRATLASVVICLSLLAAAVSARSISQEVWPAVHTVSTSEVLSEPNLPRWFLERFGFWLLPRVSWETKLHKLRWSSFFSSVASTDALWVQPFLQLQGAIFSLVAAIPFPTRVCVVQFVIAMLLMCVPIAAIVYWKLQLLRRTPSNALTLITSLLSFGVLLCTCIYHSSSCKGPYSHWSLRFPSQRRCAWCSLVIAMLLMCVPIVAIVHWKLQLLRRTPSNALTAITSLLSFGVLLCTCIYVEGPASSQAAAADARDGLGWALTVFSVIKTILAVISAAAEKLARRNRKKRLAKASLDHHHEDLSASTHHQQQRTIEMWGLDLAMNLPNNEQSTPSASVLLHDDVISTWPSQSGGEGALGHDISNATDGDAVAMPPPPQITRNVHLLDERIEQVAHSELFTLVRDEGLLEEPQWNRLQTFTLKLLITRAARAARRV